MDFILCVGLEEEIGTPGRVGWLMLPSKSLHVSDHPAELFVDLPAAFRCHGSVSQTGLHYILDIPW